MKITEEEYRQWLMKRVREQRKQEQSILQAWVGIVPGMRIVEPKP